MRRTSGGTEYTYDAAGNQTSKTETVANTARGTTTYQYDALNRLETVTEPGGKTTEYTYDAAGNRTSENVTEASITTITSYTYNAQNRMMSVTQNGATVSYAYDYNGNMLYNDVELSHYDMFNRMIYAAGATYAYNGEGKRVSKTVGNVTTRYLYEGDQVILEKDSGGNIIRNVHGANLISRSIVQKQSTTISEKHVMEIRYDNTAFYQYNGRGDVTRISDFNGNSEEYTYDAFGNQLSKTTNGEVGNNPFRYAGYMYDEESEYYYLNARYYDPKTARFLSEDAPGYANRFDPLSLNLYTYCANSPLVYTDPSGHAPEEGGFWYRDEWVSYTDDKYDMPDNYYLFMNHWVSRDACLECAYNRHKYKKYDGCDKHFYDNVTVIEISIAVGDKLEIDMGRLISKETFKDLIYSAGPTIIKPSNGIRVNGKSYSEDKTMVFFPDKREWDIGSWSPAKTIEANGSRIKADDVWRQLENAIKTRNMPVILAYAEMGYKVLNVPQYNQKIRDETLQQSDNLCWLYSSMMLRDYFGFKDRSQIEYYWILFEAIDGMLNPGSENSKKGGSILSPSDERITMTPVVQEGIRRRAEKIAQREYPFNSQVKEREEYANKLYEAVLKDSIKAVTSYPTKGDAFLHIAKAADVSSYIDLIKNHNPIGVAIKWDRTYGHAMVGIGYINTSKGTILLCNDPLEKEITAHFLKDGRRGLELGENPVSFIYY